MAVADVLMLSTSPSTSTIAIIIYRYRSGWLIEMCALIPNILRMICLCKQNNCFMSLRAGHPSILTRTRSLMAEGMAWRLLGVKKLLRLCWPWWRHQMEIFPALLALCAGNSPVTGEFRSQRPVTRSFDVFFDLRLNKPLDRHPRRRWFETPSRLLWRHCNVIINAIHSSKIYWHLNGKT